jgi:hypothetical protein
MAGPFDESDSLRADMERMRRDAEQFRKQTEISLPKALDPRLFRSDAAKAADDVRDAVRDSVLTAEQAAKALVQALTEFGETLSKGEQGGIAVASSSRAIRVNAVGSRGRFLVSFHGETEEGERAVLIQHVHRLDVLLVAVKQRDQDKPRPKIGFLQEPDPQA